MAFRYLQRLSVLAILLFLSPFVSCDLGFGLQYPNECTQVYSDCGPITIRWVWNKGQGYGGDAMPWIDVDEDQDIKFYLEDKRYENVSTSQQYSELIASSEISSRSTPANLPAHLAYGTSYVIRAEISDTTLYSKQFTILPGSSCPASGSDQVVIGGGDDVVEVTYTMTRSGTTPPTSSAAATSTSAKTSPSVVVSVSTIKSSSAASSPAKTSAAAGSTTTATTAGQTGSAAMNFGGAGLGMLVGLAVACLVSAL